MNLELKDLKRYELELDNCIAIILDANRREKPLNENDLAEALHISMATVDKLITKMQADNIIK